MMKNLALAISVSGVLAMSAWACGSDVDATGTGGTGGTGGSGGTGGTATGTATGTTTGTMTGTATGTGTGTGTGMNMCDGPFSNECEEGCCIIENQCGLQGACAAAGQLLGIDLAGCGDMVAVCAANCVNSAAMMGDPCSDILALANQNFDTPVGQCLVACQNASPCTNCVAQSCSNELGTCLMEPMGAPCQAFLQCAAMCNDQACIDTCAANNPDPITTTLVTCIGNNCSMECAGGQGGGGTGGSGTGGSGTGGSGTGGSMN